MNLSKVKWLNILLNVLVIVVLPGVLGALMYFYIEVVLAAIFIGPGLIAFFGESLKNGALTK
ncbi:MAG: hypothetical protein K2J82_00010 [Muribaculaceae bacterium]|nr:hypothetical protein [Muribaculaceae bacterium]